jgi:hypothetical protein
MKFLAYSAALLALAGWQVRQALGVARRSSLRASERLGAEAGRLATRQGTASTFKASAKMQVARMLKGLYDGRGEGPVKIAHRMHDKMDIKEAARELDGKLPNDVAALVRMSTSEGHKKSQQYDEESLQKARVILNDMMEQAWKEMDDVIFECKEFQERNRGTFEQVMADLSRLSSQLAAFGDQRVESGEGIQLQDRLRKEIETEMYMKTTTFKQHFAVNDRKMTIRKNDLAVFDMILMMTKCPDSGMMLLQTGAKRGERGEQQKENKALRVCQTHGGGVELRFDDLKLQEKVERMLTPEAKLALRQALGQVTTKGHGHKHGLSLLELEASQPTMGDVNTTTNFPTYTAETSPVMEAPRDGQWKKCTDGEVNCGLLHDLMSIEWGRFRDSFDELATEMKENQDAYDKYMSNLNEQLTRISDERTKHMEKLAQTISSINADTEESNEKDEQRRDLEQEFERTMAKFSEACSEILYTRICAVRKVRNNLMVDSTDSPPSQISDCDFTDWYPKDGICIGETGMAIDCDDTCPQADPYKCGGLETMTRDIVVAPNNYGMVCPPTERAKKCMQKKCEVDCVMSEWSGWSKCSKECESGIKIKTRSIITKAKNGGKGCDTVQEEDSCNTGSCDRDCRLDSWSEWSPCSMACGGGVTTRSKEVLVPIRGNGRCPREHSRTRYASKECNSQDCIGDEICIAHQDLVLTVDGSGSLRESGFDIIKAFAANLTDRYQSIYYGKEDMKLGLVLFGNGDLDAQPDGTTVISDALYVTALTSDFAFVRTKIEALTWQKGFTNMAQGLHMADVMLGQTGRPDAQSAVMVISDGKVSMQYQTAEKAQELKDKNVMVYLVPITETRGRELHTFRSFASSPHESNFQRIPGLTALKYNADMFAGRIIAKFCPASFSPSLAKQHAVEVNYAMIRESGYPSDGCGAWAWHGFGFSEEACHLKAKEMGRDGFSFGKGKWMQGGCYSEAITVDDAYWQEAINGPVSLPCNNGYWLYNPYFDTYAHNPASDLDSTSVR